MPDLNIEQTREQLARGGEIKVQRIGPDFKRYLIFVSGEAPQHVGAFSLLYLLETGEVKNLGPRSVYEAVYERVERS